MAGLRKLRNLTMANNRIATIDANAFSDLISLHSIDLSSNALTTLPTEVFKSAAQLQRLSLSHNALVVPTGESLLDHIELKELNLSGCNISDLHSQLFVNVKGLVKLDLSDNPLTTEALDVDIFTPMHYLAHLKVPSLSEESATSLCHALTAIDVISSTDYDISCFELVSGTSFEESIIERTTTAVTVSSSTVASVVVTSTTTKKTPTRVDNTNRRESQLNSTHVAVKPQLVTTTDATTMETDINVTQHAQDELGPDTVNVSSQTIHNILIGMKIWETLNWPCG